MASSAGPATNILTLYYFNAFVVTRVGWGGVLDPSKVSQSKLGTTTTTTTS